ncbi:MAG: response regulator [Alphaproteobacteria bacterium]|nr:response regulator [Alphaproteobacteria bacterium]MBV8549586.1 response regulator [Alphaproteobacteria bacterium]
MHQNRIKKPPTSAGGTGAADPLVTPMPVRAAAKPALTLPPAQLGVLTLGITALLGLIIVPAFSGLAGWVVGLFFAAVIAACSGYTWLQLRKKRVEGFQEMLLREAFHSVLTPQLITDETGQMVLANRAFRGWIDIGQQNAEQALSSRFSASASGANEFRQIRDSLRNNRSAIAELPLLRGGKVVEWRRVVTRPIEGVGRFFHWRFEDISERRRMEKAMHDEQTKLVDFMDNAPVGIYSVDQHGRFRFANMTLANWLQVKPDDLIKGDMRLHDVIVDPAKGIAPHALADGAQGDEHGELFLRRRDGNTFPAAITQTIVVSEDGKTLRTRSIVRDLSPEREWEAALSVSEYRFQRLFAEAPIGVVLVDGKLEVLECNNAFHHIVRRPRGSVVGLNVADLVKQSDKANATARLTEVVKGGDLAKALELHLIADRDIICQVFIKRFNLSVSQHDAKTDNDTEQGLMLYFIDATEHKYLEMQFAQSQKMQAIGQLAGGVAHDFNNLLTAMIGFCDLLLQRHKPGDQSFNDIMQIKQNGNRASSLVKQLLAFSRQQTLQPQVLNVADVLADLTSLMRRLIGSTVKLDMVHGRDVGQIKADKGQLEQVLINLVVNARDAMQQGGTVVIKSSMKPVTQSTLHGRDITPGEYVAIEVIDTGCGMSKEIISRIFEPFFSTKEVGQGTGLGLSTVYGIVRQFGGFVDVQSEVGKGSTFTVCLPRYVETAEDVAARQAAANEDKPGPDLTGAGTILLVEDEDAVRVFSTRALRNKGYNILEARSGEEALAVIEREGGDKIDLIVTDVVMPQMDGPTMYKKIREKWLDMKVIFVSGYTEDRLREQFTSGEVIYFLPKPFTLKQLAGKVKDVLNGEG